MRTECLIWDWNGTLLDDMALCCSCLNHMLKQHGYPQQYDHAGYRSVFGFPITDYYIRAGFDFDRHPFAQLAAEYMELYSDASLDCPLCPGALQVLQTAQTAGLRQVILSASEQSALRLQVEHFGLSGFFDELLGQNDFYAHGKLERGKAWLLERPLDVTATVLVGDSLHDAEVAAALGVRCVLCAAGHQPRETLETAGVPVIDTLFELPRLLGLKQVL